MLLKHGAAKSHLEIAVIRSTAGAPFKHMSTPGPLIDSHDDHALGYDWWYRTKIVPLKCGSTKKEQTDSPQTDNAHKPGKPNPTAQARTSALSAPSSSFPGIAFSKSTSFFPVSAWIFKAI